MKISAPDNNRVFNAEFRWEIFKKAFANVEDIEAFCRTAV